MKSKLKDFDLAFTGLKLGEHSFNYQIDNEFFELFGYREFLASNLRIDVDLDKKESSLDWRFKLSGTVRVPCDLTDEAFDLPLSGEMELVVKFGAEYDDSGEDILVLPMGEHRLNLAQYFYELAVLSLPLKRVSPDAVQSEKGKEIRAKLKNEPKDKQKQREETDPRWDKLKDLLS